MNRIAAVVAGLSLAFVGTSTAIAATINVPADQPTIAAAINASSNGDVINIAAGTYNEHSLNPGGKAITIQGTVNGDGTLATTIDAQQGGQVFVVNSGEGNGTVIRDLAITGGLTSDGGGGIYCKNSSPTISGCTISGNTGVQSGGGIYCDNSSPTISDCHITGNTAIAYEGGGISCVNGSSPTISDSQVCGNNPDQIDGSYTDNGGNTIQAECPVLGVCCTNGHCVTVEQGATPSECLKYFGQWFDGGDCNDCSPHLAGDLDGDGDVDVKDLDSLHASLGICQHDIDHDGDTDVEDLLLFLAGYGTTCP